MPRISVIRAALAIAAVTALLALGTDLPAMSPAGAAPAAAGPAIQAPVHVGSLRITGRLQDGALVTAAGLSWRPGRLPDGDRLLSFEVAYSWQTCAANGKGCKSAAGSTATPFAARQYRVAHADTGRRLRVTETATEVVETQPATFTFQSVRSPVSWLAPATAGAYPRHRPPAAQLVNGTPERGTASTEEYFQVSAAHYNTADGTPVQQYRINGGPWHGLPASRTLYTGVLKPGPQRLTVRTANHAGTTTTGFAWRITPMPAPAACRPGRAHPCWYPPHLAAGGRPMRWDWQIGRVTPLPRTGQHAVDIYDIDGFLTTAAQVRAIRTTWQASTLTHPRTVCYLDLAWEDYRTDASPGASPPPGGGVFPAATLGNVYYGYPDERWVDFRQLDALKPMLDERIRMCARKGFDSVELDDIDGFDPPSTTGFDLTPGDAQNFLAYAFNEIHRDGMTGLWKNSPWLSSWGRDYADGAVVEECYLGHSCFASWLRGSAQYGISCTGLQGATPCGWDDFTTDRTRHQPTGKWVGEAEYAEDNYVCDPGQQCPGKRTFGTFCSTVYGPAAGFAAVKFGVDLDGATFHPCPSGN
jgi:hypothetical protein